MALREIITVGDERLRRRSQEIAKITPEIQSLIDDMVETMHASNGVGLAAVQVGELLNIIVVEAPEDEEVPGSGERYIVINPEILKPSYEKEVGIEGCLSIPGYVGEVERSTSILVRGMDRRGKRFRLRAEGYLARVFQHEVDHTLGVLYIDRLAAPDRIWPVKEGEEETAEQTQKPKQEEEPEPEQELAGEARG
ncbi:MAG: peptide deformylase [Anaerolineales bacterium]